MSVAAERDPVPAATNGPPTAAAERLSGREAALASILLLGLSLAALLAPVVGTEMEEAYASIDAAQPYGFAAGFGLVAGLVPLSALGSIALVMAPGLLLALARGRCRNPWTWMLEGFAWSAVLVSAAAALVARGGAPLAGASFVAVVLVPGVASAAVLLVRVRRRAALARPWAGRSPLGLAAALLLVPLALLVALVPKFFWEALNGDGAAALEAGRLLLRQPLPFWPAEAGYQGGFPGMNSLLFTWPTSWFLRLFGETPAGARLPFVLELMLLFAGIGAVAEAGGRPRLGGRDILLCWAGLVSYALAMSYSATYDPYCADIALPATQDTLFMACALGCVAAFLDRRLAAMAVFAWLTLLGSAGGPVLLAAWIAAALVFGAPRPWRECLTLAGALAAGLAAFAVAPRIAAHLGWPPPGVEHEADSLLHKFRYLQFFDVQRFVFLIAPCGLYPAFMMGRYWRSGLGDTALALAALGVFAVFYVLANTALHYFVPPSILLLAAFWRSVRLREAPRPRYALVFFLAFALLAIALAWPRSAAIYTGTRTIGVRIDVSALGDYGRMDVPLARGAWRLIDLFPCDWHTDVPERAYGGSPQAWLHYAGRDRAGPKDYALVPRGAPPPVGWQEVPAGATPNGADAVACIRDAATWERDRGSRPAGSEGSSVYELPRDVLFAGRSHRRRGVVDLKGVLRKLGIRRD